MSIPKSEKLPVLENSWVVRHDVTVDEDDLRFTLTRGKHRDRLRAVAPDEVEWVIAFANLSDPLDPCAESESERLDATARILQFAGRYGPLLLADGLPATRVPLRLRNDLNPDTLRTAYIATHPGRAEHRESLGDWMVYSSLVQAILHVVRILDECADDDALAEEATASLLSTLWEFVSPLTPADVYVDSEQHVVRGRPQPQTVAAWRHAIAQAVQQWLDFGDVRVTFKWNGASAPEVDWAASSLVGALAMQLSLAVARCDRFAICTGCRRPYPTARKPQSGRDDYCPNGACKKLAQAKYQRRRRARLKAQRESRD